MTAKHQHDGHNDRSGKQEINESGINHGLYLLNNEQTFMPPHEGAVIRRGACAI
jgi:hypothetical protein